MLQMSYFGPGKTMVHTIKAKDGRERLIVVLKYTFNADAQGRVAFEEEAPTEPLVVDLHEGDPATSSIRKPSDVFDEKPRADVLLVGHAHAPRGKNTSSVDVSLRMGPIQKTLRVHGLRVWQWGTFGGLTPGPARPIQEPMPLTWELAWGGLDLSDPESPAGDFRNTLGRGVARDPKKLVGQPAAQIEYPDKPIGKGENTPAGFGALCRRDVRRALGGDEAALSARRLRRSIQRDGAGRSVVRGAAARGRGRGGEGRDARGDLAFSAPAHGARLLLRGPGPAIGAPDPPGHRAHRRGRDAGGADVPRVVPDAAKVGTRGPAGSRPWQRRRSSSRRR